MSPIKALLALATLLFAQHALAQTIKKVTINTASSPQTIAITGAGFAATNVVTLSGTTLNKASTTSDLIVANLPQNTAPGDYFLQVKGSKTATWNLTYGAVGPQGPQGIQGPQGLQGAIGATGPMGSTGPTGSQGPQGDQGLQGVAGIQGSKGDQGDIGPQGPTGPQGEMGLMGVTGQQGPMGPQGPAGTVIPGECGPNEVMYGVDGQGAPLCRLMQTGMWKVERPTDNRDQYLGGNYWNGRCGGQCRMTIPCPLGTLLAGGGFYLAPGVTLTSQSAIRWEDESSHTWYDAWRVFWVDDASAPRNGYAVCLRPDGSNIQPVAEVIPAS